MIITQLDLHHVRSISVVRVLPNPRYTVFHGPNGSGKTSWLEAIHLVCTGHSFRTHDSFSLVSTGQTELSVHARTSTDDKISLQVSANGTRAWINQRSCTLRSELATYLPCQAFCHDLFDIISAGPSLRRKTLDWGLFHVKHDYHPLWKDARRVLKQRNALLKQKNITPAALAPWNKQWVELSEALHARRKAYCVEWFECFYAILPALAKFECHLRYEKGWGGKNAAKSLADSLAEQFYLDSQTQYTHSGAHQADIRFTVLSETKAKQNLSRGQQKIVLIALKLAQTQLLGRPCLYLFDDLTSELDSHHIALLFSFLATLPGQFFFTALETREFEAAWAANEALFLPLNHHALLSSASE